MLKLFSPFVSELLSEPDGWDVPAQGQLTCTQSHSCLPKYTEVIVSIKKKVCTCCSYDFKSPIIQPQKVAADSSEDWASCSQSMLEMRRLCPSEREVILRESIHSYCGLCSVQIQQVTAQNAHSFRTEGRNVSLGQTHAHAASVCNAYLWLCIQVFKAFRRIYT